MVIVQQGVSSVDPSIAREEIRVEGNIVFVGGQGFSVAPSQQESFLRQRGATSGAAKVARVITREKERMARIKAVKDLKAQKKKALEESLRKTKERIKQAQLEKTLRAKLTKIERRSVIAREQLRVAANVRGRAFSQSETRRFIKQRGGSISGFRSARAKGFRLERLRELPKPITEIELKKPISAKFIPVENAKELLRIIKPQTKIHGSDGNFSIKGKANFTGVNRKLVNFVDVATGGALTENNIEKEQGNLNQRIIRFNNKFGGRELTGAEFQKAQAEERFIESEQNKINKKTDSLATSRRNKWATFLRKTTVLGKPARLTTEERKALEKSRAEDKELQKKIKANQSTITSNNEEIKKNEAEIKELEKGRDSIVKQIKRFRLKNINNNLKDVNAQMEGRAPPKVLAGTFPIIPAASIPRDVVKIQFLGKEFKATKDGKIVTDIAFKTSQGRAGVARGVVGEVSKDGKTVTVVAGKSGKVTINFPTGTQKIRGTQAFIGVENVSSKSKALRVIAKLTKSGEITKSKSQTLKALVKNVFKGDVRKINVKKLQEMAKAITKARKIKAIDLRKNLQRLIRKGFFKVRRIGIGKKTFRPKFKKPTKRLGRVPKRISPKGIAKKFTKVKEVEKAKTITKKDFVKRIKSLRRSGDITKDLEKILLRKVNKLAKKKGKIPREEFFKIARKIKPKKIIPKIQKKKKVITGVTKARTITKKDFVKRIKSLRRSGDITTGLEKKALKKINKLARRKGKIKREEFFKIARKIKPEKVLKKLPVKKPSVKRLSLRRNLQRLRREGKISPGFTDRASEPGFDKILARLREKARQAQKAGKINKAKANIRFLEQRGTGKIATVKGRKFVKPSIRFPSGKLAQKLVKKKKVKLDDFASISAVFKKGDLNLIIGQTITRSKARADFIGIIRGTKRATSATLGGVKQRQQFQTALNQIIGNVASATSTADKVKGLSKVQRIALATQIVIDRTKQKALVKTKVKSLVRPSLVKTKVITKVIPKAVVIQRRKSLVKQSAKISSQQKTISKQLSKVTQRVKQLSKTKQKKKQIIRQKALQKQAQLQKQKLKLRIQQKQILKQIIRAPTTPHPTLTPRGFIIPPFKKKKKPKRRRKTKKLRSYDTWARPLKRTKKQKRPKLVKVNVRPLSKTDAKNLRNFVVDKSLSRRGKIKAAKGKPKKPRLKVPFGYAKKTTRKFRRHRIVKGKRRRLPKGQVIERGEKGRNFLLDTRSEKRGITLRAKIRQITPKRVKRLTRKPVKMSASGRQRMLRNLAKARRVRMINLRRSPRSFTKRRVSTPTTSRRPTGRVITGSKRQQMLRNLAKARAVRASNLQRRKK